MLGIANDASTVKEEVADDSTRPALAEYHCIVTDNIMPVSIIPRFRLTPLQCWLFPPEYSGNPGADGSYSQCAVSSQPPTIITHMFSMGD